jgi:hypothetical protein
MHSRSRSNHDSPTRRTRNLPPLVCLRILRFPIALDDSPGITNFRQLCEQEPLRISTLLNKIVGYGRRVVLRVTDVRQQTVGQKSKVHVKAGFSVFTKIALVLTQVRTLPRFYIELACVEEICGSEGVDVTLSITMGLVATNPKPTYRKNATVSAQVLTSDFEFIEFRRLRLVSLSFASLPRSRSYYRLSQAWTNFWEVPSLSPSKFVW